MALLDTPPSSRIYDDDLQRLGYIANYSRIFALAPEVYGAWAQLAAAVRGGMDERRYELVTLVAARKLGSAYCALAHASVLQEKFFDPLSLLAVTVDRHGSGLEPVDVAVMDFAEKIAADPGRAESGDVERLRTEGLSDVDIFHIIAAVAARRFFTAVLAATGTAPDDIYDELDPVLRKALQS